MKIKEKFRKITKKLKERKPVDIKNAFRTRSFRVGGYSIAAVAMVTAIAVAANVFINALPTDMTQLDTTSAKLYSLSEETENILESLDEDITIYWIVQEGQEDSTLELLLQRYENMCDNIDVVKKDPDVYPTFLKQYDISDTYNNSLIVESESTFRYISYEDIYVYDYSDYYTSYSYDTSFAGESALTSAIDYVTSEDLTKMYILTGHGESELSSTFTSAVQSANIEYEELSLLTSGKIPDDADIIMIYNPRSDISEDEKDIIQEYLENGGNMMLLTSPPEEEKFTALEELMESYGVSTSEGIVIEGNQNYYLSGSPYYLLPSIQSHEITDPLSENGYYVLLPVAQGLTVSENLPDSVSVTELLKTSESSYSKTDGYALTTYEKEDGDIAGPFSLAVAITDTIDDETESNIVWISSAYLLEDDTDARVSGGNQDFFLNSLNWMCDKEESIAIHSKSISYEYLTIDSSTASMLTVVIVAVIPAVYLFAGVYVWIRRKRR